MDNVLKNSIISVIMDISDEEKLDFLLTALGEVRKDEENAG